MHTSTRRGFLAAGGAGLTASALAPRAAGATPPRACLRGPTGPGRGPVVAWLPDPASGQAYVLRGEQEVLVRDRRLAGLITTAPG